MLCTLHHERDEPTHQQDGRGYDLQPSQRLRQTFIVTRQATEVRHTDEIVFDYPAARKQHNAGFGQRQLDNIQTEDSASATDWSTI